MMIDSYYVIKAPLIPCRGCSKMLKSGIEGMDLVVLEYVPSATLLFLCTSCASNRIILDHLAERLAKNVDRDVDRTVDNENTGYDVGGSE